MNNNYVVCIISYKRATNQITFNTLKKLEYKEPIYIFVSDNDPQLEDYKKLYKDNIIIYNKPEIYKTMNVDLYDNFEMLDNGTIARNAVISWALKNNLKNIIILDDDISDIRYRYLNNDGKLRAKKINNIKEIFDIFVDYLNVDKRLKCLSFGNSGGYFGGAEGKFKNGFGRTVNQVFIMKVDKNNIFKATRSEDHIFSDDINNICLELYIISQESSKRGINKVGRRISRRL